MKRTLLALLALALLLGLAAGCGSLGYYAQAVRGGLAIALARRPIPRVLADPATPPAVAERLRTVEQLRAFAVAELGLPDNQSYRCYADLHRPYASWTVVAAGELSLDPVTWCFPVAGCVAYRGYFSRERAERFARDLRAQGYDVDLGGVAAFSTLGWLADPVLNTFLDRSDPELAGLLFHELAHQVAYVGDDTAFNESFATAVERAGVERWLHHEGHEEAIAAYRRQLQEEAEVLGWIAATRDELATLYAGPAGPEEKRHEKARLLAALAEKARSHPETAQASGYAGWLESGLNNARLASIASYEDLVPAFLALLAQEDGDFPRFYRAVKGSSRLPAGERRGAGQVGAADQR
ncbi:MAG: aminopeptidase [Thermoanaerobaculia bacterium]